MASGVAAVLAEDQRARIDCAARPLWGLGDVGQPTDWDYQLPTLTKKAHVQNQRGAPVRFQTGDAFAAYFYQEHPFLKTVCLDNLLIAGGSIGSALTRNSSYNDIDFFVYGTADPSAVAVRFINDITKGIHAINILSIGSRVDAPAMDVVRTEKCLTISVPDIHYEMADDLTGHGATKSKPNIRRISRRILIQLIFRAYTSIAEILYGFDLGSSAVGFDGTNLYFTSLGRFAYTTRCLILDTTRRSTTYEKRIKKYMDRGFELILPHFRMAELRTTYFKYGVSEVCELPYLPFSYRKVVGNKIVVERFLNPVNTDDATNADSSDYGPEDMETDLDRGMEYKLIYNNIKALIHGEESRMMCYQDHLSPDILLKSPFLTARKIKWFYEYTKKKLNRQSLDLTVLKRYVAIEDLPTILHNVADHGLHHVASLLARQCSVACKLIKTVQSRPVAWKYMDPGSQLPLSGSFNPIMEDVSLWYAQYFSAHFGGGSVVVVKRNAADSADGSDESANGGSADESADENDDTAESDVESNAESSDAAE